MWGEGRFIQPSILPRDGWDQAEQGGGRGPGGKGRVGGEGRLTVTAEELAHHFSCLEIEVQRREGI